jgi:hypothetical protein
MTAWISTSIKTFKRKNGFLHLNKKLRLMEISHNRYVEDKGVPRDSDPGKIDPTESLMNGDRIGAMT